VARMHFQRLKFVLVCPPVEKKMLHNAVFNALRALQSKIKISKFNYGPLAGSQT
jgi:hypothetical protein